MKNVFLLLFVIIISNLIIGQELNMDNLREKIINEFSHVEGDFAVALKSLSGKEYQLFINEKEDFHAASTMKTPVMIEVFKQAEEGKFSLSDSIHVKNEFKSIVDGSLYSMDIEDDSGEDLYKYLDKNRTVEQLVHSMITVSSNLATNILIDMVDAKNVMKTMKSIGDNDIKVLRGVEDIKAYDLGMNNTTTAYDLMLIFEAIDKREVVSPLACEKMLEILFDQKFKTLIPALLPEDAKVAHKTGSISGVLHDSGIVFLPNGKKYVLVILSKNLIDADKGRTAIQNVSKYIYDAVCEL